MIEDEISLDTTIREALLSVKRELENEEFDDPDTGTRFENERPVTTDVIILEFQSIVRELLANYRL